MNFEEYKKIMQIQYDLLEGLYFDEKISNDKFEIYKSNIIKDTFWNLVVLNNENVLDDESVVLDIERQFANINRQSCIYTPRLTEKHSDYLLKNNYQIIDSAVFMFLKNNKNDIQITDTIVQLQTDEQYNDFMNVIELGYGSKIDDENPYAGTYPPEYYKAIKKSIGNKKFTHFILYKNDVAVSIATLSYKNNYGIINNVATKKDYQKKGFGLQIMKACIDKFNEMGGGVLFLLTEPDSVIEEWYKKQGFETRYTIEQYAKNI